MDIVSLLSERWVEVAAAVYLIGMILYGHYRGFIRLCVSAAALLLSLFAVRFAQPYVTDWLKNDTPVYEAVVSAIENASGLDALLAENGGTGGTAAAETEEETGEEKAGILESPAGGAGAELAAAAEALGKAGERRVIEGLNLPEQFKRILVENNNTEVYKALGVSLFREYVSGYLADMLIRTGVFVVLFLLVFIALKALVIWLDLIAKLPILSGLNQIAGAVLGGAEALVFLWLIGLILTVLSGTGFGRAVLAQVEASVWLSWLYDHNMLSLLVVGLLQTVL